MTKFSATLDRTTRTISALVCVLLVGILIATQSILAACIAATGIAIAWAWSPRGYALTEDALVIRRLIGKVKVPLAGIVELRPARSEDLRGAVRLWGSGGLFGYYGLFRTSALGDCTWYATNRSRMVIVVSSGNTILVSPDDTEGFLSALRKAAPANSWNSNADLSPGSPVPVKRQRGRAILLASAALVIAFIGLLLSYAPGLPAYTLTNRDLRIQDRFYPVTIQANAVDTSQVQTVDLTGASPWRPVLKTNGFDNRRYRSGWFQVAGGQKVRMYRATGNRAVLLPMRDGSAPVLLEVKAPETFIEQLRRSWNAR